MKSPYQRPMVANLTSKPRSPWILKPTPIAYFYEFLCRAEGRARAIPVVRDLGVHLSGLCDQHGWPDRRAGVVLPSAGHRGEPDQGSQQRCGVGCASLQALGHELRSLPTGHAGLQPELLVVAVQSGKDGRRNRDETYATVDGAIAFSVSGGQDLVPCRPSGHQLQRSLPGERNLSTADGSLAAHHRWRQRIRTCRTHRSSLLTKHHAWFFGSEQEFVNTCVFAGFLSDRLLGPPMLPHLLHVRCRQCFPTFCGSFHVRTWPQLLSGHNPLKGRLKRGSPGTEQLFPNREPVCPKASGRPADPSVKDRIVDIPQ